MRHGIGAFAVIILAVLGALWIGDHLIDRTIRLSIVGETPLYQYPPQDQRGVNPVLSSLRPGETVAVTRMGYGKDFQAFRVESRSGVTGWVIGGPTVLVVSRGAS
jgi:hypothetical protein